MARATLYQLSYADVDHAGNAPALLTSSACGFLAIDSLNGPSLDMPESGRLNAKNP